MIASGQQCKMGVRALVIVWDWVTRTEVARYDIHKLVVASICFNATERYVISLGGPDCGSIVVWDLEQRKPICGATASKETTGAATRLHALKQHASLFVSCGDQTLRIWAIDAERRKLRAYDVLVGKIRRQYSCIQIDPQVSEKM